MREATTVGSKVGGRFFLFLGETWDFPSEFFRSFPLRRMVLW